MKNLNEIFFVLMARTESVRVPNKMLRPFADSCLWEIACEKFANAKNIPEFHVSVRDETLAEIGKKYGAKIWWRSEESTQEPNSPQGVCDWRSYAENLGCKYFMYMNPSCSALTPVERINEFVEKVQNSPNESFFSVLEKKNFCWSIDGSKIKTLVDFYGTPEQKATLESKLVETRYEAGNCLYFGKLENIKANKIFGNWEKVGDPEFFVMDLVESFDIDELDQFELAEFMYKKKFGES